MKDLINKINNVTESLNNTERVQLYHTLSAIKNLRMLAKSGTRQSNPSLLETYLDNDADLIKIESALYEISGKAKRQAQFELKQDMIDILFELNAVSTNQDGQNSIFLNHANKTQLEEHDIYIAYTTKPDKVLGACKITRWGVAITCRYKPFYSDKNNEQIFIVYPDDFK